MIKMHHTYFCLLCLIITFSTCNTQFLDVAVKGVQLLYQIYQYENNNMRTTIINQKLTEQIHYLNLMNSIEELKLKIERLQLDEPDVTNMKARMYDLQVCSDEIDMRYKEYITYSKSQSLYDKSTLENYYTEVMNENNGIPKLLFKIHEQVVGLGYGSLLNIIDRYIEYIDPYCEKTKSRQRYFYDLFLSIMSYETKGFLVLEYAYALKRELKNKTLVQEFKDVHRLYHERANATFLAFKEIMSRSEQVMWKCDPIKHTKNKSYAELRNVFRRVFYDAQEFHSNFSPFHCDSLQCPTITKKKRVQPVCQGNNCFFRQRHCSNIVRCRQLLKNEAYDVCVLKNQDHGRRYSYVNKETSEIFAGHPKCDGQFRAVYKVIQSYPGSLVDTECNVCDCICDESENSDRYISLRPVTSDVHNNYVVTGVQFQVVNHTLYIKIQEGELLPFGFIHGSSTRWKDIEAATDVEEYLDEIGINLLQKTRKQKQNLYPTYQTEWSKFLKYGGKGRFKLNWFNGRGLYLDNFELRKKEIVTGVRFTLDFMENNKISVMLDIQATPLNYQTGELMTGNSYWMSTFTSLPNRIPLERRNCDTPILLDVVNKPDGRPHKYLEFAPSALTSKDAGQTLLPLIDIQPVTSDPPVPLMGVSLDIKRAENSGGFLMLKTKTYNTLWHLND